MNLSFEPLQPDSSLDARLSPSPNQYPIEFNSNVFNTKPQSRVPQFAVGPVDYDLTNDSIMADVSLFNNSLLEQTTPPAPLPDQYQSGEKTDPSMDDITNLLDINNTNSYLTDVTALTPVSQNKGKEFIPEMPFNPISNEDDELLFESALAAADCLVVSEANLLPQSTSAQTSTDTSTALNISNFGELNF